MAAVPITKPIQKLKKVRSWDEIRTRGGQAFSAYIEQRYTPSVPSDEELVGLMDASQFGNSPIIAESIWKRFYDHGKTDFFPSFRERGTAREFFQNEFAGSAEKFIHSAEEILHGRIDLLGHKSLFVGTEIDWHREPVSDKRSPFKHWKEFDELDAEDTGDKKIVWELNRHQHFFTLGVAYMLTKDERFADAFVAHLSSWIEQNPPSMGINWASSLEVGFRAMSWVWAFHFFRDCDHFTPKLFRKALKYLYLHGRHIEQYLSKYYSPNTHLTGEALALYYLGTQLRFFKRADHWRKLGENILFDEITRQVHEDGVYFEQSTAYQRYTLDLYSHFSILRSLDTEAEFDLRSQDMEERLRTGFDHLMHMTRPDGCVPLIGDEDGGRILPLTASASDDLRGTLAVGSVIFDSPEQKYISASSAEEIFWLMGPAGVNTYFGHESCEPDETSKAFNNGGYFVMRDGWEDTDNMLVVDCGEVGSLAGGHGHADALAVEVAIQGRSTLVDPGTYTYHESREMRDRFRSSTAHNTLSVDGLSSSEPGNAFNWRTRATATLDKWIAEERFDLFEGSHDGYRRLADPVTHERNILFLKNDYWMIRDVATAVESHEFSLNFQFAADVPVAIGDLGEWIGDDFHRIYTFGDNGSWQQEEAYVSRQHGDKQSASLMRFVADTTGTQEFFTFILPCDAGFEPPSVTEVASPRGRAFAINYRGYTDLFLFNDESDTLIDTGVFESDFKYTWARMREGESMPDEITLVGGSRFNIKGESVIDEAIEFASIRRLGCEFYISSNLGRSKRQLFQFVYDAPTVIEKKSVLQFIGSFNQGGSERQAIALAETLKGSGAFDVRMATLNDQGFLREDVARLGFKDIPEFPLTSFYDTNFITQVRRCANYLRENSIDLVHTHDFYTNVFGMAAASLAGVKVKIASKRETDGMRSRGQQIVEDIAMRQADAVVVNSRAVCDYLVKRGVSRTRIKVIHNGVDVARFASANGRRRSDILHFEFDEENARIITLVANLRHEVKNVPMLMRVAKHVVEAGRNTHFVIAGEGDLKDGFENEARKQGLGNNVHFIGRCGDVPSLLAASDICVLTSTAEGFSNSILEYMAAGRPVVATDVGGAAEAILHGDTGFLVEANDAVAMTARIVELLDDKERRNTFGERARRVVEDNFSRESQLENTAALYRSLLDR